MKNPYAESAIVHRAVQTVVTQMAGVPFRLYAGTEADKKPVESGPWYDFFLRPSDTLTRRAFWNETWKYTQVGCGEAFWLLLGRVDFVDEREIPYKAVLVRGEQMEHKTKGYGLDHWLWQPGGSATKVRLEPWQVIQFAPILHPDNQFRGISPMGAAMREIKTDDKAAQFNEALLANGARPSGILTTTDPITADQAKQLGVSFRDRYAGAQNAGKVPVLPYAAKWVDVSMSHREMEFQAIREWARQSIGAAFGVPLMFLATLDDLHKETSRQVRKMLWEATLLPTLALTQDLLEAKLFYGRDKGDVWGKFDLSGIEALSEEQSARRENAQKDILMGYPRNEVNGRWELGYEDQGDSGNVGLVALGLQTVDDAAMGMAPDIPDDSALAPVAGTEGDQDVEVLEDLVLNGAQIAGALQIVLSVVSGELPLDSGLGMLQVLFNLTMGQAKQIMGSAGTDEPTTPNPMPDEPDKSPSPPSTTTDDDPEDVDEEGRAVSVRRDAKRQAMWEHYIRSVQRPGEKKMQKKVTGWQRGRRADTLRWLGTADDGRALTRAEMQTRKITDAQIDAFLESQHDRWFEMLRDQTKSVDTSIISATLDRAEEQIGGLEVIDMQHPRIIELIEARGGAKIQTTETMQKKIRRSLVEGSAEGESIAELQERVRKVFKVEASRAQTIARTESAAASSQAKEEVFKAEGIEETTWLSAGDGEERPSHAESDGKTRKRGEKFPCGLRHPHEDGAAAEEVCNCRCEAIPEV